MMMINGKVGFGIIAVVVGLAIWLVFAVTMDGAQKAQMEAEQKEEDRVRQELLGEGDLTKEGLIQEEAEIKILQETEKKRIYFHEVVQEDADKKVGDSEITQEGIEGEEIISYEVTYKGDVRVSQKEISREVTKEKKDRILTKGTKELAQDIDVSQGENSNGTQDVKLGKSHTGQASWYAYKGCDCAANPWLPKGSRAKVTAVNSGKSVIVTINDRGPFVPGRIIDLDKTAFEKIAPLGAGVIEIKMEEVVE